jgi:hypothetical protein
MVPVGKSSTSDGLAANANTERWRSHGKLQERPAIWLGSRWGTVHSAARHGPAETMESDAAVRQDGGLRRSTRPQYGIDEWRAMIGKVPGHEVGVNIPNGLGVPSPRGEACLEGSSNRKGRPSRCSATRLRAANFCAPCCRLCSQPVLRWRLQRIPGPGQLPGTVRPTFAVPTSSRFSIARDVSVVRLDLEWER